MSWFKRDVHEIIELVKENEELKRGLGDIMLFIVEANRGKDHRSLKNDSKEVNFILNSLEEWKDKIK